MILWTLQNRCVYDNINKTKTIRADENYICEESFKEAYYWMADQMRKRIGEPPNGVIFPVWAWYQWEGKRKRTDMRSQGRGWAAKGTTLVLLTVDVPDHLVLLSDFEHWHVVLNQGDLVVPYDSTAIYSEEVKQKSRENIFDISCSFHGEVHKYLSTQATVWEIKQEWIKKTEFFIAR